MDEVAEGVSEAGRRVGDAGQEPGPGEQPGSPKTDPHAKGTMREPAQTPGGVGGDREEARQALQDLEETKGDWSKGG
jgi:hypothetical protein